MVNIIRGSAVCFLLAFSLSATANPITTILIERNLVSLAEDTSDTKNQKRVYGHAINHDVATVMELWENHPRRGEFSGSWGEIGLNILQWAYPEHEHRWFTFQEVEGVGTVYHQNSLIDLERVQYRQDKYVSSETGMYIKTESETQLKSDVYSSSDLMLLGKSPIGPDNMPIKICSLGSVNGAPYLELSQTQINKYSASTGLDFSSCLDGLQTERYWAQRRGHFIDLWHDYTQSHHPRSSW